MLSARVILLATALLSLCSPAHAQHVVLWAGGGVGTFVTGGSGIEDLNSHRITSLGVSLPHDRIELRALKGTFERSRGIPTNTGDNDFDYLGFDVVVTREATGLPVDLAIGAARYEEAYHLGYPLQDLGGRMFVHRWGPHVSALRSLRLARFFEVWAETDLHYAPYRPRQLVLFVDLGVGVHF